MCPEPGPSDQFIYILIDGVRFGFLPVVEFEKFKWAAQRLVDEYQVQVKVLPVSARELSNICEIEMGPPRSIEDMDADFRKQAIQNCMDMLASNENLHASQRETALSLLKTLGALNA